MVTDRGPNHVDIDMLRLSVLPSIHAETYQQMWACGNHYRVEREEDASRFVTQDFGIASIFGAEEGQSAGLSMVGVLKEIIVVRYSAQHRVVFHGSWIRNDPGPRASTKVDQYGFTMVRFNDLVARNREPYVLPAQVRQVTHAEAQYLHKFCQLDQYAIMCTCKTRFRSCSFYLKPYNMCVPTFQLTNMEQVFFIRDWKHPSWRVVLQKEPRARRVLENNDEQILGISGDLIGLQLPLDMNAIDFWRRPTNAGERVPAAEVARLNALVQGERHKHEVYGRARERGRGRGRGNNDSRYMRHLN